MDPFIKYQDGSIEQSYVVHIFYLASIGFNIVPGAIIGREFTVEYEAVENGIKLRNMSTDEVMVLPYQQAMHMFSTPSKPNTANPTAPVAQHTPSPANTPAQ